MGMNLVVVGTGSSGNTYLLTNGTETLVLDCGVPFLEVKKALGFNISGIQAALVTHRHNDHQKYVHEYETAGIAVWKPYEADNIRQSTRFGGFGVQSFGLVHDVPCAGYLITHKDFGKVLYATDTSYIPYRFRDLNVILIEANWGAEYVHKDEAKYIHTLQHHMSIETCVDAIRANRSDGLNHVILCHLSDGNSNQEAFRAKAEAVIPTGCTLDVADSGMVVSLDDVPF